MESTYWQPTVSRGGRYLDVYSSLLEDGIVFVNAKIDQRISGLIATSLLHLHTHGESRGGAKIYLNSKDGDILAALSVVDIVEHYKRRQIEIQTVGFGELGPAATLILASGTPGRRKAASHCHMCVHLTEAQMEFTNLSNPGVKSRQGADLTDKIFELLKGYTGKSIEFWRTYVNTEQLLTAEQARERAIIDELM